MGCGGTGKFVDSNRLCLVSNCQTCKGEIGYTTICPGCEDCYDECEYWALRRESVYPLKPTHGYKCGRCDTCCSESDEILMRRKEEE